MIFDLLATKLRCPSIPKKRVQRPHLLHRLNEGLAMGRPLTLVSAPAGFGKSTCTSEWVQAAGLPFAWLALDPADDDPARFFTYLIAALQRINENLGHEIESVLRAGQLPPTDVISTALINDLLDFDGRFILILDDLQVIQDGVIWQVLADLVRNPPESLHLALLSRADPPLPLARLRANNQLTEIRPGELRFSIPEAEKFLNEMMDLSLSHADITLLQERTEGWVVGMQLAGLSIRDRAHPSDFISALSGSHRFLLSYLTEEILSQQPEEVRRFLLQTAILNRLSADLCNAVTLRTDSHALLERMLTANLFLIPLDDEQRWYRYHHLFAELLRDLQRTAQEESGWCSTDLHQRASRWYDQAGMAHEAIHHALAASDPALAIQILDRHAMDLVMQGYTKTVECAIRTISPGGGATGHRVNFALALKHLLHGDKAQAAPYLERLEAIFAQLALEPDADPSLPAERLALQSMLLIFQGKMAESLALGTRALALAPEGDNAVHVLIYLGLAWAYRSLGDDDHLVAAFQQMIHHCELAKDIASEMFAISGLVQWAIQRGDLQFGFERATQAIERIKRLGVLPAASAAIYDQLGQICFEQHRLEEARGHFQRARRVSTLSGWPDSKIAHAVMNSRLAQLSGDLAAAEQEIQPAIDLLRIEKPIWVREEVIWQQVHLYLMQNRISAAEMVLVKAGFAAQGKFFIPELGSQQITPEFGLLYNSALRLLLHRAVARQDTANLQRGIALASGLITVVLERHWLSLVLEALLLRAQMNALLGHEPASQADNLQALKLAEPEGYITVFLEAGRPVAEALAGLLKTDSPEAVQPRYLNAILSAFSIPPVRARDQRVELLTEREIEVLRLMAEGRKYEEIAAGLFVSLNTVRWHIKSIYRKLGVSNRTQAIETARQLNSL